VWRTAVSGTDSTSALAAAAAGAGAAADPLSRSTATMRPSGPVPETEERSIPRSRAILLARGDALIRPPFDDAAGAGSDGTSRTCFGAAEPGSAAGAFGAVSLTSSPCSPM
jgi:hypothetical protein